MKIITFANYDFTDSRYFCMGLMWLNSVSNNFNGTIEVISRIPIEQFFRPHVSNNIHFIIKEDQYEGSINIQKFKIENWKAKHNIRYKMFHLCKQTEPYFYLDLDTVVLNHLSIFIQRFKKRKLVFPTRNGGIILVNDPSVMNWNSLIKVGNDPSFQPKKQGSDQTIYWKYFNQKDNFGNAKEWNTPSLEVKIYKSQNKWKACYEPWEHFIRPVYIIHYLKEDGKPWVMNCPIYRELTNTISTSNSLTDSHS